MVYKLNEANGMHDGNLLQGNMLKNECKKEEKKKVPEEETASLEIDVGIGLEMPADGGLPVYDAINNMRKDERIG